MFKNERDNMNNPNNKVFLIIKKTYWEHDGDTWFDVAEKAKSKVRAYKCVDALNTLNGDKKVSYLISELNNVEKKKEESKQLELPFEPKGLSIPNGKKDRYDYPASFGSK